MRKRHPTELRLFLLTKSSVSNLLLEKAFSYDISSYVRRFVNPIVLLRKAFRERRTSSPSRARKRIDELRLDQDGHPDHAAYGMLSRDAREDEIPELFILELQAAARSNPHLAPQAREAIEGRITELERIHGRVSER